MSVAATVPTSGGYVPHVTHQLQYRRCGNARCQCAQTGGHGPYWYAYWRPEPGGRLRSRYVGKQRPVGLSDEVATYCERRAALKHGCQPELNDLASMGVSEQEGAGQ